MNGLSAANNVDSKALFAIFLIPVIWGIGFPLTHNAVQDINPGLYAFFRALVAAIALLPLAFKHLRANNKKTVIGGALLGLFSALNTLGQSYALKDLSSATTAFLVTLNIIFIPFLFYAFSRIKPSLIDILSVAMGVLGAYIILGPTFNNFSTGYLWGGLAAFSIAMTIALVSKITTTQKEEPINRVLLSFYQILFCMIFLLYFPIAKSWEPMINPKVWGAIIYMGIFSTALAVFLQITYQKQVGATRTSIIFNLDLVFASLFGLINKEPLYTHQIIGGLTIFIAAMIEPIVVFIKKSK